MSTKHKAEHILPCPCCGSAAILSDEYYPPCTIIIICTNKECCIQTSNIANTDDNEKWLINKWNTRNGWLIIEYNAKVE